MKAFGCALIASFCIQMAVLAGFMHYPAAAALLWIAVGVVIFQSVRAAGGGVQRRSIERIRDALATLIIVGGLLRFIMVHFPGGGSDRPPDLKTASKSASAHEGSAASVDYSGDHTGVILLPEPQKQTTLVPPLPSMPSDLFDDKHQNPLSIPFYGAYWFFKLPDTKPPPGSYVTHGTPTEIAFHAPDHRLLVMEAHQNLGKLIDLAMLPRNSHRNSKCRPRSRHRCGGVDSGKHQRRRGRVRFARESAGDVGSRLAHEWLADGRSRFAEERDIDISHPCARSDTPVRRTDDSLPASANAQRPQCENRD